jgi:hypothetical protein
VPWLVVLSWPEGMQFASSQVFDGFRNGLGVFPPIEVE